MTATLKKSFLVDTNILVYLSDNKSPFYSQVFEVFEWFEKNEVKVAIAHQNIIELINTLVKDYGLNLTRAVKGVQTLLTKREFVIIYPLHTTIGTYFSLVDSGNKGTFDLYLAATAIDNGIDCIVTNDPKAFKGIKNLEVLDLQGIKKLIG